MIGPELEPGHGSPGHRVSDYGRVGSDLGSKLYMNRPGAVTRFPGEQQTSSVRPLAPSKRVPLIASQLVPRLAAPCYCLQTPPPRADQRRYRHDREQKCDLHSLSNTNFYDRSCCTSGCKAPVGNLN